MNVVCSALILGALTWISAVSCNANLVAIDWGGELYSIDSSLEITEAGFLGANGFNSMATDSNGVLHTIRSRGLGNDIAGLYSIDSITSTVSLVQQFVLPPDITGASNANITAMAYNSADGLFYFTNAIPSILGDPRSRISDLYSLDAQTGNYSLVGSIELGYATSLAFSEDGTLYSWIVDGDGSDNHTGLATIDVETGIASDVNELIVGATFDVQTLAFDPDGRLFGARQMLYEIDLDTGELLNGQLISNSVDIRGMEFVVVPLPAAYSFFLSSIVVLRLCRRK